jgi:hypothetical protein
MDKRDIDKVAKAFDRLLSHVGRTCDADTVWAIAGAKDDILDILTNDWHADEPQQVEGDAADLYATVGAW